MQTIKTGKYKHSKTGNFYEVLGTATHSETREILVVYANLYDTPGYPPGSLWVRPFEMFTEIVEINGKKVPRFEFVSDQV